MITYREWKFLVELYKNQAPHLAYSNQFGLGHRFDEKKQLEIEEKHEISIGAYCVLGSYAGNGYSLVNKQLREDKCDEATHIYHDFLIRALDELPSYSSKMCLRWPNIDEKGFNFLKKHVDKRMLIPQFWSTSKHNRGKTKLTFEISTSRNSNSRHIENVVGKHSEKEVLFKAHTVFSIDDNDRDTIYLTEMENCSDYDLFLCEYFWEGGKCFRRSKMYEAYLRK